MERLRIMEDENPYRWGMLNSIIESYKAVLGLRKGELEIWEEYAHTGKPDFIHRGPEEVQEKIQKCKDDIKRLEEDIKKLEVERDNLPESDVDSSSDES